MFKAFLNFSHVFFFIVFVTVWMMYASHGAQDMKFKGQFVGDVSLLPPWDFQK